MNEINNIIQSVAGAQSKFYNSEENMWYKQDYLGTEGLSEYISSKLLDETNLLHVSYTPCEFRMGNRTVVGCKSNNFLDKEHQLISAYELIKAEKNIDIADEIIGLDIEDRIQFFVNTIISITNIENFGECLTNILQLDAITKNDDRHFNNISFLLDRNGNYSMAPIYDNGAAFLADQYTYGDHLSETEIYEQMSMVQAKPFSIDFDEQLDICERLYPSNLKFNKYIDIDFSLLSQYYSEEDINKTVQILRETKRQYSYLFESRPLSKEILNSNLDFQHDDR